MSSAVMTKAQKAERFEVNLGMPGEWLRLTDAIYQSGNPGIWSRSALGLRYAREMNFSHLLETGQPSPVSYKSAGVYIAGTKDVRCFLMTKRGIIVGMLIHLYQASILAEFETATVDECDEWAASGIWLPHGARHLAEGRQSERLLLINGDESFRWETERTGPQISLVPFNIRWGMPVFSFACLERLFSDSADIRDRREETYEAILKQRLVLLDYTKDETIPFTDEEKRRAKKRDRATTVTLPEIDPPLVPPKAGFTQITGYKWHRSGSALFEDRTRKQRRYYLLGQDESTYFGCELSEPAKTVARAFELLVPEEARGTAYKRQGEWFLVPSRYQELPPFEDRLLLFGGDEKEDAVHPNLYLPVESKESNKHHLGGDEGFVARDGRIFAYNPVLSHEQHQSVTHQGWCVFHHNTAVRSVSQEGVD